MSVTIVSARLALAPFAAADLDALHALFTGPEVRRYLFDDIAIPLEQAADILERSAGWFRDHGFGLWTLRERTVPDGIVGCCGCWPTIWPAEAPGTPELIYALSPSCWGRGYATESARAVLAHVFAQPVTREVLAATDVPNVASARVLDRLGFACTGRGELNGLDTLFYRLPRARWPAG